MVKYLEDVLGLELLLYYSFFPTLKEMSSLRLSLMYSPSNKWTKI